MRTQYVTKEQRAHYVENVTRGHKAWQKKLGNG